MNMKILNIRTAPCSHFHTYDALLRSSVSSLAVQLFFSAAQTPLASAPASGTANDRFLPFTNRQTCKLQWRFNVIRERSQRSHCALRVPVVLCPLGGLHPVLSSRPSPISPPSRHPTIPFHFRYFRPVKLFWSLRLRPMPRHTWYTS